ncbi:hypothetical protein [Bacillus alkalisoli]|uniref:hypothetical protein n=1 Tax=Bacillus alkalisoli TaxID=2011008 RepID=UPI000C240145|nr:hypothetical protein [Bacillus alkalisoli]
MTDWYWKEADELEKQEKWYEAKNYMYLEWKNDQKDLKKFIRLSFLCWYVVVEWGCIETTDLLHEEYENLLKELTIHGFRKYSDQPDFLWTFGYMISMFPYYFGEHEEWENIGKEMLAKAYHLRPSDLISKMVYLGILDSSKLDNDTAYKKACLEVSPILSLTFRGEGAFQRYFKEVLEFNTDYFR